MPIDEGGPTRPDPIASGSTEPDTSPGVGLGGRGREWLRRGSRTVGLILLAFVVWVWVLGMTNPYGYAPVDVGVLFAMALVAAGVLLLRGQQPVYEESGAAVAEPKPRSPLGVLTLSIAFVVLGAMILIGNLEAAEITMGQLAAAGLLIVGLGLLIGAWWGRSRFLILVGLVSVPFVIAGGFLHFPLRGSIGDRWTNARSIDAVPTEHEILVGGLNLNLADLRSFSGEREIDISMAAGTANIFVPERMGLTVTGHIEFGNAHIGKGRQQGNDLALGNHVPGKPDQGHLTINFKGGITSLYVERISYRELHGGRFAEGEVGRERYQDRRDGKASRRDDRKAIGSESSTKPRRDGNKRRRDRAET